MKKKTIFSICVIVLLIGGLIFMLIINKASKIDNFSISDYGSYIEQFSSEKKVGETNDAKTAKKKAEEVWIKLYGEEIKSRKPYRTLYDKTNEVWLVQGSLPENMIGGVPYILIQKADGRILAVWHTK